MFDMVYFAEKHTEFQRWELERKGESWRHKQAIRGDKPSRLGIVIGAASASAGQVLDRGIDAVRSVLAPSQKPSSQCC